jgi:HSP20 family molecular chaperone IbpA
MSTTLTRWRDGMLAPFDWGGGFLPLLSPEIRVEQVADDGHYVVRAEIPGVDPEKEVEVTVMNGVLRIQVERRQEQRDKVHSEFHYGRFVRSLTLPTGVIEKTATATCTNGLLEISFKTGETAMSGRHIAIDVVKSGNGKE